MGYSLLAKIDEPVNYLTRFTPRLRKSGKMETDNSIVHVP